MDRAVCIHGHVSQPPREHPWIGEVEVQRSAAPYHDWNERVTAECYEPNTAARLLDPDSYIGTAFEQVDRVIRNLSPYCT